MVGPRWGGTAAFDVRRLHVVVTGSRSGGRPSPIGHLHVTLSVSRSGDAVVQAHPRALFRAVANLLDNAVRHAAEGGTVTLDISERPGGTVITVTDDGPGAPPEERARMVQRFAQLDRSHVGSGGAGLGLAILSAVAAAHDGCLEIADGPSGRGLAVSLYLPVPSAGLVRT